MTTAWDLIIADETFVEPPDPAVIAAALYPKREKKRPVPSLATLTTKHLLAGLHYARASGSGSYLFPWGIGSQSHEAIKAELAKRPHIARHHERKQQDRRGRPRPRVLPEHDEG